MTLVVEKDEPFDPVNVGFLGPRAVMACANRLAHLIEEFGFRRHSGRIHRGAVRESVSAQWVYLSAFHVVSSRSDCVQF
jgi:hypothetical protein